MQQLKNRLADANERRKRYELAVASSDEASSTAAGLIPNVATIDPDLMLMQHAAPVAIDGPTEQLLKILAVGEDEEKQHAKVISIVGMAGIGKTTLALHVYQMLRESFDCGAFVYVGRRPSVTTVLVDIISQVSPDKKGDDDIFIKKKGEDIENDDERTAMGILRDILQNKRYLSFT
jgi:disease resistance protein RPM1